MEKEINLFAYGTLMWPEVLEAVMGRRLASTPATLAGFKRLRVRGASYPVVVPSAGGRVEGVLYRGLSHGELRRLDAFEGGEYDRVERTVDGVLAQVYVLAEAFRHIAEETEWTPDQMTEKDLAAFRGG